MIPLFECVFSVNLYPRFLCLLITFLSFCSFQKNTDDIAQQASYSIEQHVIHIKASQPEEKLYRLRKKTEQKSPDCRDEPVCLIVHKRRQQKAKWHKCNHVANHIQKDCLIAQYMAIFDKALNFPEQSQVISVVLNIVRPSHFLGEKEKVKQNNQIGTQ